MAGVRMETMPANKYLEIRNGAYYVAGTRIGLDVIVHDFRNGLSAEAILDAYPSIGALGNVYGTIAFILEHPKEIQIYLQEQDSRYEEFKAAHPMPPDMIARFERGRREISTPRS
jgi:uncharacterized protein (DUF433 family)